MNTAAGALAGIRVLDFTQVIFGPSCTAILADHGAEVIKVERPGPGDLSRAFAPFIDGRSLSFASLNRNKKSIAVDLKSPAGLEVIHRLAPTVDVVANNFRPGVMESLALGYEDFRRLNPRIIYASGTGFGTSGPLAEQRKAGQDTVAQALTGAMAANVGSDGGPRKIPIAVADITGGNLLAQGVLLALIARERTGEGQTVETSLLDALIWMQAWQATGAANVPPGDDQPREGDNPLDGGVYRTRDAFILVTGVFGPNPLAHICTGLGIPDLSRDERFASVRAMIDNALALRCRLQERLLQKTTAEWIEILEAADVLCAPLLTIDDAVRFPQVLYNEMIVPPAASPDGFRYIGVPSRLGRTPGAVRTSAPALGEHTVEVLRSLAYSPAEIDNLIASATVAVPGQL